MLNLVVHGNVPSKKNSRRPFIRGGRIMNFPSKNYTDWHKGAQQELELTYKGETIEKTHTVILTFFVPTRRKYDLSNKAESVMDTLVDAGVLQDDNFNVVPALILAHGDIDKENPRCEIQIIIDHDEE